MRVKLLKLEEKSSQCGDDFQESLTISVAPNILRALLHRAIQICCANDVNCLIKQKSSRINSKLNSFIIILLRETI